jgi:immune inhibitor A
MWNNYHIEEDWDFGFVEVSTDGGSTWTEQKVFNEAGAEVSTPDNYADPNGRMADYGNKKYGLTGATDGMEHHYVSLTPYAGTSVQLRLRYATDAGFQDIGWFADDFAVTDDGTEVWTDDVEGADNNGWTLNVGTWTDTTGQGWHKHSGTIDAAQFYLAEWRNFDGFDEGLKYAYDTTYQAADGAWKVEKIKYNAPGMLVWYRDSSYGENNHVLNNLTSLPSEGAKGGLLIVDSHFDPLRRTGAAAALDPSTLKNLPSRPQSSNAAFGLTRTYPFQECVTDEAITVEECTSFGRQAPVSTFTDNKGWYPGIEVRGEDLFYRDADASVVVPSRDLAPYSTRVVDQDGNPLTELYGLDIGLITPLGSGNPADDGVAFGTQLQLRATLFDNRAAQIRVTPPAE